MSVDETMSLEADNTDGRPSFDEREGVLAANREAREYVEALRDVQAQVAAMRAAEAAIQRYSPDRLAQARAVHAQSEAALLAELNDPQGRDQYDPAQQLRDALTHMLDGVPQDQRAQVLVDFYRHHGILPAEGGGFRITGAGSEENFVPNVILDDRGTDRSSER